MECGELAKVKSAARFAYGELGKESVVPANATITYELELLEVLDPIKYGSLNEEELVLIVEKKKTRGNELYQRKEYFQATNSYQKGLQAIKNYLDEKLIANIPPYLLEMQIRCLNNIAAAQLKVGQYSEALSACQRVLEKDSDNVKALYRAGRVLGHLGEMEKAIAKLHKALALHPQDKAIQIELNRVTKKKEQTLQKEKKMYRRMVGTDAPHKRRSQRDVHVWGPWPYMAAAGATAIVAIGIVYLFTQRHAIS